MMLRRGVLLLSLSTFFPLVAAAYGAVWYVDASIPTSGEGTSPETAFKAIQEGIQAADDGDTVVVAKGTYSENIQFNGKNIALRSSDPLNPSVVASTIIDGNQVGSVVTFDGTEGANCVVSGFTIRNGSAEYGGGICGGTDANRTHATVGHNTITGNEARRSGGGLAYCDGLTENNIITDNSADWGGGLARCQGTIQNNIISGNLVRTGGGVFGCHGVVRNNTITNNSATAPFATDGGGIYDCDGIIDGNTISGNVANREGGGLTWCDGYILSNLISGNSAGQSGGGLAVCKGRIENNAITGNSAGIDGGGLYECEGPVQNNTICRNVAEAHGGGVGQCTNTIRNCIIWGNAATHSGDQIYESSIPSFSCIQDWDGIGKRNTNADPAFANPDGGDYRLQPASPCIDSGAAFYWFAWPQRDVDGNCRLAGGRVDMGCYEYGAMPDSDGDVLPDSDEAQLQTDADREDTDGDGLRDGLEILRGSNPLEPTLPGLVHVPSDVPTIQGALLVAMEGDEIIVAPGEYCENLRLFGGDVFLHSSDPMNSEIVNSTIIDAEGFGPVVSFTGFETEACVLAGFTIQNGSEYRGGGINGGAPPNYTHATIEHNVIRYNSAHSGGGLERCDGTIRHNIIYANSADWGGGLNWCTGTIDSNVIYGNIGDHTSGIHGSEGAIRNCIIWGNRPAGQLLNCAIPTYSCIESWSDGGAGNISNHPHFVDAGNGDFHLQPWSPCIDAGYPSSPFSEEPEPNGGRINMGGYGNTPEAASKSADSDGDGLPDDWEIAFFGDLIQGQNDDPDGDQISNIEEYNHGYDPMSFSAVWYVDGSVAASGNGSSWAAAFKMIQEGIDAAGENDTVIIAQGTYVERIHLQGKNIILRSTDPLSPVVVANTVIDGDASGSVVTFGGTEGETCILSGFTIRNGNATGGGGICGGTAYFRTRATIQYNTITGNVGDYGGGLYRCDGLIQHNAVLGNGVSHDGGGLCECAGTIRNNLISGNEAQGALAQGGGLSDCRGRIELNTIAGNSANEGGGLHYCRATIQNNVICDNTSYGDGGGLLRCYGEILSNTIANNTATFTQSRGGGLAHCSGEIRNCIIWGNEAPSDPQLYECSEPLYSCVSGLTGVADSNLGYAPYFANSASGDYHLQSWSPCIDAGDPASPFSSEPDPKGGRINMGAYGNTSEAASKSADSDHDELPDDWEIEFFGNLGYGANDDWDEDFVPNIQEYHLGSNPKDTPPLWYVDRSVTTSGDGTSWQTAFKMIQEGIAAAVDGERVVVAPGIYPENVHLNGKNITLMSTDPLDSTIVASTVISGKKSGAGVSFSGAEKGGSVLSGFTIKGGSAAYGGGVCGGTWDAHSTATIRNNVITGNSGDSGGGIAFCAGVIENNTISDNSAIGTSANGGGVFQCNGTIRNNVIIGNSASGDSACGGGLAHCDGDIRDNRIGGNSAVGTDAHGGGMGLCHGLIFRNSVTNNSADGHGGGLFDCGSTIQNNFISANSCIEWGGGLYDCDETIQDNTVSENSALYGGGLAACSGEIADNRIYRNSASAGGGLLSCGGEVRNNVVCGNDGGDVGGGLYNCDGALQNNVVAGNSSIWGAGLALCDGSVVNNTIVYNSALWYGGGLGECDGTIQNCIIWGNDPGGSGGELHLSSAPSFCCIEDWGGDGQSNLTASPQFVDADGPDDDPSTYEDNDFRLSPLSPCIDAGSNVAPDLPDQDSAGNPRIAYGGRKKTPVIDMGAYEYYINRIETNAQGSFVLTWSSLSGLTYSIYCSSDLIAWQIACEHIASAGDTVSSWTDSDTTPTRRFYRIQAE